MAEFFDQSYFAGITLSLAAYCIGLFLKKRFKSALFNPLLIAVVLVIVFLLACDISYDSYEKSTQLLSWLLTPATVCLAIPLYEQLEPLKKNIRAVSVGVLAGTLGSLTTVLVISVLCSIPHDLYVTFLPKSITTAIGMGVSEELGGYVTITVAVIILTGMFGNIFGEQFCRIFGITEPISRGLSIGTSSHAIGTAKAMELGEVEGAMSSLSIAVSGLITVILAPIYAMIY